MARLGAQLLMQAALEAEITEFLGTAHGQQVAYPGKALGSKPVKTAARLVGPRILIFPVASDPVSVLQAVGDVQTSV